HWICRHAQGSLHGRARHWLGSRLYESYAGSGQEEATIIVFIAMRRVRPYGPRRSGSEILLVPHVRHGAFVGILVRQREGILAAGDDILGADGELPAPWSAPGQAETQAFELAWLAGHIDDASDDVGAER